jgi:hypothetical protein
MHLPAPAEIVRKDDAAGRLSSLHFPVIDGSRVLFRLSLAWCNTGSNSFSGA